MIRLSSKLRESLPIEEQEKLIARLEAKAAIDKRKAQEAYSRVAAEPRRMLSDEMTKRVRELIERVDTNAESRSYKLCEEDCRFYN